MIARILLLLLFSAGPAFAHSGGDEIPDWEWDFWITAPLAISAVLYSAGVALLWRRAGFGRAIRWWQAGAFAAGWLTVFGALCSPLHWYAEHLFSAHMVEHELLMAIAAPLFAVSRPIGAFLRALPKSFRSLLSRMSRQSWISGAWRGIVDPVSATVLHAIALWAWHAPALFEAAVESETYHRLQHLSFFVSALIFWWAIFRRPVATFGHGGMLVFATMAHMTLLGALLALSPHVMYPEQTQFAPEFGLTPLEDQELGGLIMWIPAGTIYAAVAMAMCGIWIARSGTIRQPRT
jgi:putative membrane protein